MKKFELQTIQNGAVLELFNAELDKVLSNIEDKNTKTKRSRSITIKITIEPDEMLQGAKIGIDIKSHLANLELPGSHLLLERDKKPAALPLMRMMNN